MILAFIFVIVFIIFLIIIGIISYLNYKDEQNYPPYMIGCAYLINNQRYILIQNSGKSDFPIKVVDIGSEYNTCYSDFNLPFKDLKRKIISVDEFYQKKAEYENNRYLKENKRKLLEESYKELEKELKEEIKFKIKLSI